ncbi:MAG: GFA family protein [Halioglobus sp.]
MIKGHCECGRISYTASGPIEDYSHCHCSQCRRLSGAAYASFAGVNKSEFSYLSGESDIQTYASSASHRRFFCGNCGSNVGVALDSEPDSIYLAMGSLDGALELPKGYHIYVNSKANWHTITDDLPQFSEEPDD